MDTERHNELVTRQYDPRAEAYLTSAVHAQGEDLDLMARLVGDRPQAMALDMGCGGGHVAFRLAPLVAKVIAYDLSGAMLATVAAEAARRGLANLETLQGSAETLPCPDASFDLVATRYSAHHWHDFAAGLVQMHRTLKPGGLALFMDVVTPGVALLDTWLQTLELLRDPSHVRNASPDEWQASLQQAGFVVQQAHRFRLRLEFASWVARMQTPAEHVAAIRSLQQHASDPVKAYFAIEGDGSFHVDSMLIAATRA